MTFDPVDPPGPVSRTGPNGDNPDDPWSPPGNPDPDSPDPWVPNPNGRRFWLVLVDDDAMWMLNPRKRITTIQVARGAL
jgi:hypothetical protein